MEKITSFCYLKYVYVLVFACIFIMLEDESQQFPVWVSSLFDYTTFFGFLVNSRSQKNTHNLKLLHRIWCDFRSFGKIYSSVIIQLVWGGGVPRFWLWSKVFRHKAYKKMRWIISLGLLKKRPQHHQFVHLTSFFAALNQISSNLSLGCPEII